MDKKSFLYKRLTVCLFLGIFLSIVLSMNYLVSDIDSNNLQEGFHFGVLEKAITILGLPLLLETHTKKYR